MATICSCNNTTAASTHTSTPSSLASSTCGTNCHQTQWGLLRSLNSRTDLPPPRCIKSYYGPCFISTSPCTVFTSFTNVLYFYMNFISAHLLRKFYSWSKHKRICTVRQYSGSLAHPRGMYYNGKEGRKEGSRSHDLGDASVMICLITSIGGATKDDSSDVKPRLLLLSKHSSASRQADSSRQMLSIFPEKYSEKTVAVSADEEWTGSTRWAFRCSRRFTIRNNRC